MLSARNDQLDFLHDPEALYPKVPTGHNWRKVSRVLEFVEPRFNRGTIWGHAAHLVELCAVPSPTHKGRTPSASRVQFLQKLFEGFASEGVRTIVLHSHESHHDEAQKALASSFLGISLRALPQVLRVARSGVTHKDLIEHWDADGRRVVRCRNLSNSLPNRLLQDIAALVY